MLQQLHNITVKEGERVVLECTISPYPLPEKVQWFKNSIEIQASPDYQIGYTNGVCRLIIVEVFPEDSGNYSCTVCVSGASNTTSMELRVECE